MPSLTSPMPGPRRPGPTREPARITSQSGWQGGNLVGSTQLDPGMGGGGGRGPGDFMAMFRAMQDEGLSSARSKRRMAEERHGEWMGEQRRKRAPKLTAARRAPPMDPMRYANQARQAMMHGVGTRSGTGGFVQDFGQGTMKAERAGNQEFERAMSMYPMYYQAMMAYE